MWKRRCRTKKAHVRSEGSEVRFPNSSGGLQNPKILSTFALKFTESIWLTAKYKHRLDKQSNEYRISQQSCRSTLPKATDWRLLSTGKVWKFDIDRKQPQFSHVTTLFLFIVCLYAGDCNCTPYVCHPLSPVSLKRSFNLLKYNLPA